MQRVVFGIFAHPDDEAFGPAATLISEVEAGAELHLICATRGEFGINKANHPNLGEARVAEWRAAGELIGARPEHMHELGYLDGHLAGHLYHEVADKLEAIIRAACKNRTGINLCFMTFDPNGITGHLDHIAMSYITTFLFYRLKANPPVGVAVKELAYFCLSHDQKPSPDLKYFIFSPAGHTSGYINRSINARPYLERKYAAMRAHRTQEKDADAIFAQGDAFHATDHFHVIT